MKKLLFLSVLILFTGCAVNKPALKLNGKDGILKSEAISSKKISLNSVDIVQYKLRDANSRILFYEEVSTWDDYEFRDIALKNISYIFNAKGSTVIYSDNTTVLVQIELIMNQFLNVIAYSDDMENLSFAYGMSNHDFKKIARGFLKDSNARIPSLRKQGMSVNQDDMPLTRWSETKLIVKPFTTLSNGRSPF